MTDRWLGLACSLLRVVGIAAAVVTAFSRLAAPDFIRFSQFHVGLSFMGFVECLAVVERSRLYAAGTDGQHERAALLGWARRIGMAAIGAGALMCPVSLNVGSVLIGGGIASLALPESAVLREQSARASRLEFAALVVATLLVGASWLLPHLGAGLAVAMLVVLAMAPRLTLALLWRGSSPQGGPRAALAAVTRNIRSIAPFAANQAALPWLFAVPNYVVPHSLPAREASWILLGLRASGAVASMLARTLVQRWIRIADGHTLETPPRAALALLGVGLAIVVIAGALGLPGLVIATSFGVVLSLACALQAVLSTHLNARGLYLVQLPSYATFWLTGSAVLLLWPVLAAGAPSLGNFCAWQTVGAAAGALWMARLAATPPASGR